MMLAQSNYTCLFETYYIILVSRDMFLVWASEDFICSPLTLVPSNFGYDFLLGQKLTRVAYSSRSEIRQSYFLGMHSNRLVLLIVNRCYF